jgi:prepilin-type N-terminal cleavage/methylation domain-containing protein
MDMNLPKYSKGFTLIELLVVISIISIIGGGIIPSFSKYVKDQNLKQAQEQLKSDLRTIQNKALTGAMSNAEIPVGSGNRVKYWGVYLSSGSETVNYYITTETSTCPPTADGTYQGNFKIPNTVVYRGSSSGCLFFDIKNGDIVSSGVSNPINIDYASANGTVGKNISFTSAGLIY